MDEVNNYGVIGLEHLFAMRDEIGMLRYDNEQLHCENEQMRLALAETADKQEMEPTE